MYCGDMNHLAQELNNALEGSAAGRMLSSLGRKLYFPKGIVTQSTEAGERAHRLNATIGMAVEDGMPMVMASIADQVPGLDSAQVAAYAPTAGIMALRREWQRQLLEKNPSLAGVPFSLPIVVAGLTNGVFQATELFVDSGDVVLIPDLYWGNYNLIMEVRRGAHIVKFHFFDEDGAFNVVGLREALVAHAGRGKIILVLNFPNNPSGYSPLESEVAAIRAAIVAQADAGTDILVLCDDAYFGLFYEPGVCRESVFAAMAAAHERILAVKVDGSTKEDMVWGFRVGFMTFAGKGLGPVQLEALQKKLMGALRGSVSSSSGLAQHILLQAFANPDYTSQKAAKAAMLEERYRLVRSLVAEYEAGPDVCLHSLPFNSGYFMAFRCLGLSAEELRLRLLDAGIGTIAIGTELLRVAYSSIDLERIPELYAEIFAHAAALKAARPA